MHLFGSSDKHDSTSPSAHRHQRSFSSGSIDHNQASGVDDMDEVDDGNRNIILSIISQLRPGSDLSRITLPTFILERKSMLERITNLMQHPEELIVANQQADPALRFLEVARWYMSGWHIAPKAVKKPLNPVLGEYFTCYWDLKDGSRAYYVAEQTSHHPPKSSYFYEIPNHNIRADGLLLPRSRFLGNSAASLMEGVGFLTFGDHDGEQYRITQPNIYARNILLGSMKFEMGDHALISCEKTGFKLDVEFKVKGFVSGSYHSIAGKITHNDKPVFQLSGKWNGLMEVKDLRTNKTSVFLDCAKDVPFKPSVRPLAEQGEFESQNLWANVCEALGNRDHETATTEKSKIEDSQRALAKCRSEGTEPPYAPKLFIPCRGPLEFVIAIDTQLEHSSSSDHENLVRQLVPIFPGDKFASNFEASGELKSGLTLASASAAVPSDSESEVFVDAQES